MPAKEEEIDNDLDSALMKRQNIIDALEEKEKRRLELQQEHGDVNKALGIKVL